MGVRVSNQGVLNELRIIDAINGKQVKDVGFLFQDLFYSFFKNINETDVIKACKGREFEKTDIIVKIGKQTMNISVKMGIKNSVHCEGIYYFLKFLKELKIPYFAINEYLLYHYADGTMNGTGSYRLSANEYKKDNMDKIDMVNRFFNNPRNLEKIANRFIFKGTNDKNSLVDIILWGTPELFFWVTRDEVKDYLKKTFSLYMTCPHFARLSVQASSRSLNYSPNGKHRRKLVGVKWYNIFDSIIEILNDRSMKNADIGFLKYCKKLHKDILNGKYEDMQFSDNNL